MPKKKDEEEVTEEEPKNRFVIKDVPTQTMPVILDRQTNKEYDMVGALMQILEELHEIKKLAEV